MRPVVLLLIASLAVNAVVLVRTFVCSKNEGRVVTEAEARGRMAEPLRSNETAKLDDAEVESVSTIRSAKAWETLRGGDLKGMVARLRAAGFPSAVIRSIIYAEIQEQYKDRQLAFRDKMGEDRFWLNNRRVKMDTAMLAENRAINQERNALTRSLLQELGKEDDPVADSFRRRQYGDLAPEKIRQLELVLNDYNELRNEIYTGAQGIILPEDREKLAYIEKEQQQDLVQLLTPGERAEYELRSSPLSNLLRSRFNSFEPTEAEFRALYDASRAAGGVVDVNAFGAGTAEQARQREAAIANALRTALAPDRFAEFLLLSDPQYAAANRLTTRLNLPASAASEVVSIQKESLRLASEVRTNAQMNTQQKAAQLALLEQQTVQRLTTTLGGESGLIAYRQNGGGWLQSFVPQSSAPAGPRPSLSRPPAVPLK